MAPTLPSLRLSLAALSLLLFSVSSIATATPSSSSPSSAPSSAFSPALSSSSSSSSSSQSRPSPPHLHRSLLPPHSPPSPPPNIVFIVADDLGFNELGFQNSTRGLRTPHIDALAAAGVVLTHYYTHPLCSPTRGALLTGLYSHRLGLQANVVYWDTPWAPAPSLTFLPQRLRALGYRTAMFGKYHLGFYRREAYPTRRGFDVFEGYLQGCGSTATHVSSCCDAPADPLNASAYICPPPSSGPDYRGYDWFVDETPAPAARGTPSSIRIAERAEQYITSANASEPFFLYLPFQNIHAPYDCQPESFALFPPSLSRQQRVIFGYLYELDQAVGRVVAALRNTSALNNTVIVFVSDNGAPQVDGVSARNYPLRGFKSQVWEGGTRVPAFVVAPGRLAGGRRVEALVHVVDWTPTLVRLAGGVVEAGLDGMDVWDALARGAAGRAEVLVNVNPLCDGGQFGAPKAALRVGDVKLVCWCYDVAGIANASATGCVGDPAHPGAWPQLFNLTADPAETTNLAAAHPKLLASLEQRLKQLAGASVEPMQWTPPYQGPHYACADCPLHPKPGHPLQPWESWL